MLLLRVRTEERKCKIVPASCSSISLQEVTEEDFCNMLIDFFRPHIREGCSTSEFDLFQSSQKQFSKFLKREDLVNSYTEFLFSIYEIYKSTSNYVIQNALTEYCFRRFRASVIVRRFCCPECYNFQYEPQNTSFRNFESNLQNTQSMKCNTTFLADYEAVKRCLRYGIKFHFSDQCVRMDFGGFKGMLMGRPGCQSDYFYLMWMESKRNLYILMAIYITLWEKIPREFIKDIKCYSESFKLLFKTITEPLITLPEIESLMNALMNDAVGTSDYESERAKIQVCCRYFLEKFPKSGNPIQPRTLKHLSRVQVRESLISSKNLPHGVWKLNIPKTLQNYILLQKTEDEFHPKYVSYLCTEKELPSDSSNIDTSIIHKDVDTPWYIVESNNTRTYVICDGSNVRDYVTYVGRRASV